MEKMKMSVGTMAAIVFVAVAVSALVINFGMVQAMEDKVKASIKANLKLEQKGDDVKVTVKANGLESNEDFTVRAYSMPDCKVKLTGGEIGTAFSNNKGKLKISGTISSEVVDDVNSVSFRDDSGGTPGQIVVCFRDTTPP